MSGVSAILLAAGESRRMGSRNKMTLPVAGVPLLRRIADTLVNSEVGEIVAVLGHGEQIARALLADLCTPAELEAMVDRWRVAQLLDQGLSYREIRELTAVSVTTIGRVARFIEQGTGGYRTILDRLARNRNEVNTT